MCTIDVSQVGQGGNYYSRLLRQFNYQTLSAGIQAGAEIKGFNNRQDEGQQEEYWTHCLIFFFIAGLKVLEGSLELDVLLTRESRRGKFGKENKLINCRVLPLSSQSRNAGNEINCLQETFLETFANQISFLQKVIIQMAL